MAYSWVEDDDLDDDDDGTTAAPKPPDLPAPARKHLRKVEKERDELKAQLAKLAAEQRKTSLKDVVKAKGFSPIVANFIPAELDGDDAISKWLDENGSVFAKSNATVEDDAEPVGDVDEVDEDTMAGLAQVSNVTSRALSPTAQSNILSLIQNAKSKDELDKIIQNEVSKATRVR